MTTDLILGTAGHIDHGKTALIRAITGTDTDRLPEEKKRGITIELGFAELTVGQYRLGVVDVPGHERFVRNMLAGATGMDLAMLIVAADDSVNQQTREHLDILRLLDLPAGIVVITKTDLADPDWTDLVEEEIRQLIAGSFLEGAPIIRTSVVSGDGLEELRAALQEVATTAENARAAGQGPFRMAIDRCFTIAGHGTVVTGSISSGTASVGDSLVIQPDEISVRVRGIQNHDHAASTACRGQRAAINLAGVHHGGVRRGHELASPGHLTPSRRLTTHLQILPETKRPLKNRSALRLHIGTAEVICNVRLIENDVLEPGESGLAQLLLAEPVVSTWNQPFVIRAVSPMTTIGGGRVVDTDAPVLRRPSQRAIEFLRQWHDGSENERASAALYFQGTTDWKPESLARTAGIPTPDGSLAALRDSGELIELPMTATRMHRIHTETVDEVAERIRRRLIRLHAKHPLRSVLERNWITQYFSSTTPAEIIQTAAKRLQSRRELRVTPRGWSLVGHSPKLSQNETKLLEWICQRFRDAGIAAPKVKDLQSEASRNKQSVPQLVAIAVADGDLIELDSELVLHRQTLDKVQITLREHFADHDGLTLSQIREFLGTTRKYAVPLCEYLDRTGFTRRDGDLRFLNQEEA